METALLPDEEDAIAAALEELERKGAALVLTVGGTGLGPRDRTPEATRRVIDREAPGLAEAMRAKGAERNTFAWLSRGVAGLRGKTLIVNLPGSKRGAEESLESILPLLRHGLEVVAGGQDHPIATEKSPGGAFSLETLSFVPCPAEHLASVGRG